MLILMDGSRLKKEKQTRRRKNCKDSTTFLSKIWSELRLSFYVKIRIRCSRIVFTISER